ncbi:GNAT family N-acetyltransferase [Paenibacillus camerounensis]|uniref:GNAT family N-acetyltransferase n=1 Tax=Paenibacillus camerounensis TaxID=1243663 RepID=UPI0005A83B67|nr:GNAT family N-acetyltransferase [Paenibacillus camerounensis]
MEEIFAEEFKAAEPFFNRKKQHIPALSVLRGHYPGRVFVDRQDKPELVIVWATGRWMYAAGDAGAERNIALIRLFLQNTVIPDCISRGAGWFEIYADGPEAWDRLFLSGLPGVRADKHFETVYELQIGPFRSLQELLQADQGEFEIEIAEYPIVAGSDTLSLGADHHFMEKKTVGASVNVGGQTASLCRNNGFTVGNEYFIDADTYETAERNKGYGTQAAAALIGYYVELDMLPLWETTQDNLASQRLALKLGFLPAEQYPVYTFKL